MYRGMRACADEFLAAENAVVVHCVHKVVIRSSFCVTPLGVEVNGRFGTVSQLRIRISDGSQRTEAF